MCIRDSPHTCRRASVDLRAGVDDGRRGSTSAPRRGGRNGRGIPRALRAGQLPALGGVARRHLPRSARPARRTGDPAADAIGRGLLLGGPGPGPAAFEPEGLLHHDRRRSTRGRTRDVSVTQPMSYLMVDEVGAVGREVGPVGRRAADPTMEVEHGATAPPTRHVGCRDVQRPTQLAGQGGGGESLSLIHI